MRLFLISWSLPLGTVLAQTDSKPPLSVTFLRGADPTTLSAAYRD